MNVLLLWFVMYTLSLIAVSDWLNKKITFVIVTAYLDSFNVTKTIQKENELDHK